MHLKPLLVLALVSGCSLLCPSLFAQIKIGTNPTQIEATSNLEVEASTTGRKFKVDKTTGRLTIADGTQDASGVLTSDANGLARWAKIGPHNIHTLSYMTQGGLMNHTLTNGNRVNLAYPSDEAYYIGEWNLTGQGVFNRTGGRYLIETSLSIENGTGCTGTSVMGLELNLVTNGQVSTYPALDERLTPVYQDTYVTKVQLLTEIQVNTRVSFSVLPTIKSPQEGCVVKITRGSITQKYIP